jgi:thioredoxin-like negative regulator of GroEL
LKTTAEENDAAGSPTTQLDSETARHHAAAAAAMANNQRNRVSNAIDSLITHLVPAGPHDDEQSVQERHDACFELVRNIFER